MKRNVSQVIFFHILLLFFSLLIYGQKTLVTGTVYGEDGFLEGASISFGSITTASNSVGRFLISLNIGSYKITITHIGYKTIIQDLNLAGENNLSLNFTMIPEEKIGEPIVLGSRVNVAHNNLLSPVPVDVVSSRQLIQTQHSGLTQMLQFTVPSFNASRQLVNEPVTLRGLEPDQLLILVNGKRYHNMSFLNFGGVRGILGRGAVSNDLNSIPFSAIDKIEILKDGASAQYGSDAISGVINVQLKRSINKLSIQLNTGQYYKGDGKTITVESNYGLALSKKGFLNFSGSYRFQDPTYRGGRYNGTVYTNNVAADDSIIRTKNFDRNKPRNAGASKQNGFGFVINGGYEIRKQKELFLAAGMNHRTTVFTSTYIFPKNVKAINSDLFPDGFKARPSNHSNNIWGIAVIKGYTMNDWQWEYSSTFGTNFAKYYNKETNNASQFFSLGINAPTRFYTGSLIYGQFVNSIQTSKRFISPAKQIFNLGFGAEWRSEYFQIKSGEDASWNNYDLRKFGGSGGLVFSPTDEVKASRNVVAGYLDLESEFNKLFLADLSARYEYYNDFGSNLAGKVAVRYKINKIFSIRSSISNGFRAPSLQQRYYSLTRLGIPSPAGEIPTWGIFRNNSAVANALGIPSLEAERSLNISGGFVASFEKHFSLAVDAYWIRIKDRIVLSGTFDRTNPNVDSLLRGITKVDQVQFLTNAINTKTKGIDIIVNGKWKLSNASLAMSLAANITQTKIFGPVKAAGNLNPDSLNSNTLFDRAERGRLEKGQPDNKLILSFNYKIKKIELVIRNTRFGRTSLLVTNPATGYDEFFSAKILTDINIGYSPKKWITVTAGANNIFNIYPDRLENYKNTSEGQLIYSQEATPFGFNGGYYFLSISIKN